MKRFAFLALIIAVFPLTGCVTDDPRQGGFIGGVVGLASGSYDDRVAARQAALADQQSRNLAEQWQSQSLEGSQRSRTARLETVRQDLDTTDRRIKAMEARIRELRAGKLADETTITKLSVDLAETKRRLREVHGGVVGSMDEATASATAKELQREIDSYENILVIHKEMMGATPRASRP